MDADLKEADLLPRFAVGVHPAKHIHGHLVGRAFQFACDRPMEQRNSIIVIADREIPQSQESQYWRFRQWLPEYGEISI